MYTHVDFTDTDDRDVLISGPRLCTIILCFSLLWQYYQKLLFCLYCMNANQVRDNICLSVMTDRAHYKTGELHDIVIFA